MKHIIAAVAVASALTILTGCEHIDFEIDWKPLLESVAAQVTK